MSGETYCLLMVECSGGRGQARVGEVGSLGPDLVECSGARGQARVASQAEGCPPCLSWDGYCRKQPASPLLDVLPAGAKLLVLELASGGGDAPWCVAHEDGLRCENRIDLGSR